ncbi:uncharacterized protein LOC144476143 isoform X2 [Augochlora pura]
MQCSKRLHSGAACLNNACVCVDGYYYFNGRCNAYSGLSDKCDSDVDCYVHAEYGAAYCNNGRCSCSPGYYQREYRTCRPEGKKVGDACTIKNDCKFSETADCDDYKCIEEKLDALDAPFFSFYEEENPMETEPDLGKCKTDGDCKHVNNMECSPLGNCVCKRAHFYQETVSNETCIPELGEPCKATDEVAVENSECKNKKWNCVPGRIASADNRNCLKAVKQYSWSCLHDEQCSIFGPDSVCDDKKCVCNKRSHFVESELFCWTTKGLGEQCQRDFDCHLDGVEYELNCKNNVCQCPNGTLANKDGTGCLEDYVGIGSSCDNVAKCQPENSVCRNKFCVCEENYVNASFKSCLPLASYGKPCEEDIQCSTVVPNAVCSSNDETDAKKTCECRNGQHYKQGRCNVKRVLGEGCGNLSECYLSADGERAICRNGRCACDWAYTRANDTTCALYSKARYNNNGNTAESISGGSLSILMTTILSISYHSLIKDY